MMDVVAVAVAGVHAEAECLCSQSIIFAALR